MKFELKPYNRDIPDQELLDDLKKVAQELNKKTISGREYDKSKSRRFGSGTIAKRFNGWNNAIKKAGLEITQESSISYEELIEDLKRVANQIAPEKLTQKKYNESGKYTANTINERFGWNDILEKLGLEISNKVNISEKELFENLEEVWVRLGHQPGRRDMIRPVSAYSEAPYLNKYGSWRKALEAFVEYINSDPGSNQEREEMEIEKAETDSIKEKGTVLKHKTKRDISDRLKVKVLMRDVRNGIIKCSLCGIPLSGAEIHYDHIFPWAKGGETVLENIQILCAHHNLAKGDCVL